MADDLDPDQVSPGSKLDDKGAESTPPPAEVEASKFARLFEPRLFVCLGRVYRRHDNSSFVALAIVYNGHQVGDHHHFALTKQTKWYRPGAMYTIEFDGQSIRPPGEYVGMYPNTEQIAQWQLASRAAEAEEEMVRRHKKEAASGDQQLLHQLYPLRKLYASTIGTSRRLAIEVAVLEALRKAPNPKWKE